jgi:hypothetical protein
VTSRRKILANEPTKEHVILLHVVQHIEKQQQVELTGRPLGREFDLSPVANVSGREEVNGIPGVPADDSSNGAPQGELLGEPGIAGPDIEGSSGSL